MKRKKSIERLMFYFKDGDQVLNDLNDEYFPLDNLLTRLLNESYSGKKMKFINIKFSTSKTYELYPQSPKHHTHYHSGHLWYNEVFDLERFMVLDEIQKRNFVWKEGCKCLRIAATKSGNLELVKACDYAFQQGLNLSLNPDFPLLQAQANIHGLDIVATLWINFDAEGMRSKLLVERNHLIILEKEIDRTKNGVEFFLDMYTDIQIGDDAIILKGHKEVDYLPLTIPLS